MSWSSVALYTLTGTLTNPKEIEPFQMERILPVCPYDYPDMRSAAAGRRPFVQRRPIRQVGARPSDGQRRRVAGGLQCRRQHTEVDPGELGASLRTQQTRSPQRVDQADHER